MAVSQAPTEAALPWTWGQCITRCVCLFRSLCWSQVKLLGDRVKRVWTTCPGSHSTVQQLGSNPWFPVASATFHVVESLSSLRRFHDHWAVWTVFSCAVQKYLYLLTYLLTYLHVMVVCFVIRMSFDDWLANFQMMQLCHLPPHQTLPVCTHLVVFASSPTLHIFMSRKNAVPTNI